MSLPIDTPDLLGCVLPFFLGFEPGFGLPSPSFFQAVDSIFVGPFDGLDVTPVELYRSETDLDLYGFVGLTLHDPLELPAVLEINDVGVNRSVKKDKHGQRSQQSRRMPFHPRKFGPSHRTFPVERGIRFAAVHVLDFREVDRLRMVPGVASRSRPASSTGPLR